MARIVNSLNPDDFFSRLFGLTAGSFNYSSVGGGSINSCYRITLNSGQQHFCKINSVRQFPQLFLKEKNGLETLSSANIIRTPAVLGQGQFDDSDIQYLLLEWIDQGLKSETFWGNFGEQLAQMHNSTVESHGHIEKNYMGALPQSNHQKADWTLFFISERLWPQVRFGMEKGMLEDRHLKEFENLYPKLPALFGQQPPSLLHGDLWSGNFLADQNAQPVLIDPAVYYGSRHMDLAMTTLFGGFGKRFYAAYNYHYPIPPDSRDIWAICNLYPLLIHLNLFGKSYLPRIEQTIKAFL
jgi:fructosamine-3-kinase